MYEHFYGLRERPFDLSSNTKFLFLSAQHHEALTHLRYGLSGRPGITLLIGEAGMGKSTLIRAALASDKLSASKIVLLSNPTLTREEFYEYLAHEFEFPEDAATSKTRFLEELTAAIDKCHAGNGVLALIVDEAQSLSHELLEELRLLTNTEGEQKRTPALVLVGQPELGERLKDPSLRQLKQRVSLRAELHPFTLKETAGYIAARITVAGGRADAVFTRDAVVAIHEGAKGLPRTISVICDNALVTGFADNSKPVNSDTVATVCADFDLAYQRKQTGQKPVPAVEAVGAAAPQAPRTPSLPPEPVNPTARPGLFGDIGETKRFSFFRGARR